MDPGVREKRTGIAVAVSVPSVGCSTRWKKPVAARCGSSNSASGGLTRECGMSASASSASQSPVVRSATMAARSV